jgi:hypothetical protein
MTTARMHAASVPFSFQDRASGTVARYFIGCVLRHRSRRKRNGAHASTDALMLLVVGVHVSPQHNFASGATRFQCAISGASL